MTQWDVAVIGAGPAGLMAAIRAAENGRRTLLVEKNAKPGAKILLSGGSRCNLTHATDRRGIVEAFGSPGRFLYSALAALGPQELIDWFHREGVPTKVEDGGKVFPVSDRASDVLAALVRRLKRSGCKLALAEPLNTIEPAGGAFRLITASETVTAASVILATGGRSYPASGSTGDGYRWAAELGHSIVTPRPALVPITTHAEWVRTLQGIAVHDVSVRVVESNESPAIGKEKVLAEQRGAVVFAHFGLSGPAILNVSRAVSGHAQPQSLRLLCDFLPAMSPQAVEDHLIRESRAGGNRQVTHLLAGLLPHRLAEQLARLADIGPAATAAELTRDERRRLVGVAKAASVPIAGTMGFRKAEVTAGGVALDQVDSKTMQSRLVSRLYFAGELLDLDGPIGGYNFQAAFSTGYLAGGLGK